ncbi:hypothetical protein JOD82_001890 [Paenibacillus sp. 1182]|uniref:hypothetical protein n=1 Tax=Paenibacillus sp. 1182 TaxID=2806565 RepID=UPI001AE8976A|nr:hypothetical protein [Paenibacillus sp. 1182]MBP1308870.1 hypothetical protein [Paenibacillus sp. 1182]
MDRYTAKMDVVIFQSDTSPKGSEWEEHRQDKDTWIMNRLGEKKPYYFSNKSFLKLFKKSNVLNEIKQEADRRIVEMSKNWNAKRFSPIHAYPYVFMQVYSEKVSSFKQN